MSSLTFIPISLLADNTLAARSAAGESPPIVFGREAVFVDTDAALAGVAARLPSHRCELQAGKVLAAVVQKGRLFQQAYPDVKVLRDRGRFLLVELDPDHRALAGPTHEPCFAAYRVEPGAEVFRELRPSELRAVRDPAIGTVLEGLSAATFRAALEKLVALRTRLSTSDLYRQASDMCCHRLQALGYQATLQDFDMPDGRSRNVLAVPNEAEPVAALVMGHLDSVNHAGGPDADAPGADDNGSGSAGVIAMAEALATLRDRLAVGFALFGGRSRACMAVGTCSRASPAKRGQRCEP